MGMGNVSYKKDMNTVSHWKVLRVPSWTVPALHGYFMMSKVSMSNKMCSKLHFSLR